MTIGERLKELRKQHDMTLQQVGDVVGVGKSAVRKWESGMVENIRFNNLHALAKLYNTTPQNIMYGGEIDNKQAKELTIGERIKARRKALGPTQQQLASTLNLSKSAISMYENGEREPDLCAIEALAKALNTTPQYLAGWNEQTEPLKPQPIKLVRMVSAQSQTLDSLYMLVKLEADQRPPDYERMDKLLEAIKLIKEA